MGRFQYDMDEKGLYSGMFRVYGNKSDGSYDFTLLKIRIKSALSFRLRAVFHVYSQITLP